MDQHRRRRHEPKRHQAGAKSAIEYAPHPQRGEAHDPHAGNETVSGRVAGHESEHGDADSMQPKQNDNAAMSLTPRVITQLSATRHNGK
jgi:hypothetical protein